VEIAMMKKFVALPVTLLALLLVGSGDVSSAIAAQTPQTKPFSAAQVAGVWKVTKVRTDPKSAVAALLDDDPSYVNATVAFSPDAMTWNSSKTNGKGNYDNCKAPTYAASSDTPGAYAITCSGDSSEFHPTVKPVSRDTLILNWYDGGILTLTRQR
jgi:hypothetical protein